MTWIPLLLADRSPNLRWLVLRELLQRKEQDPELQELAHLREGDPLVQDLLGLQAPDGSFRTADGANDSWEGLHATSRVLLTFAYLGFDSHFPAVERAANYLFSRQGVDGSWPLPISKSEREFREAYSLIPLQTAFPLRSLAAAGYGEHPKAEQGYRWLMGQRLEDGAWHSGMKGEQHVFPAGYRRLAQSRFGCRTNTTLAVCALALHPTRRHSPEARQGLDILLAQGTLQASSLGHEVARIVGVERSMGFFTYFAHHDPGLILDLCWRIGASLEDERVAELVDFVKGLQGVYGLWDYPPHPRVSRWLTFDLLRSLSRIDQRSDWISLRPRTPFQPYPKDPKRY